MSSSTLNDLQRYYFMDSGLGIQLAKGTVANLTAGHRHGRNQSVGTTEEDIWGGSSTLNFPTAAETIRIKAGGNAADAAAGAGARTITVVGLDGSFNVISEDITTNGTSASTATTATFIRIHTAYVKTCGTYGAANTGAITIENTTSTSVLAVIPAALGRSESSLYTVPAGYNMYMTRFSIHPDASQGGDMYLYERRDANDVTTPYTPRRIVGSFDNLLNTINIVLPIPLLFPAYTDVWFAGVANSSTCVMSAEYDYILEQL